MQRVQTEARRTEPPTTTRMRWRFGRETFGVLRFECETFRPTRRPFPQTAQVAGMGFLQRIRRNFHGAFEKSDGAPTTRPGRLQGNSSRKNKDVGDAGEDAAARYLALRGFEIVARNVRYRSGEIDIIARRKGELHFFEVRTRSDSRCVHPSETIVVQKQRRIRRAAELYLGDRRNNFNKNNIPACYFSVISIDNSLGADGVECILDAFNGIDER